MDFFAPTQTEIETFASCGESLSFVSQDVPLPSRVSAVSARYAALITRINDATARLEKACHEQRNFDDALRGKIFFHKLD